MITTLCALYGLSLALSISGAEFFGALLFVIGFVRYWKEKSGDFFKNPLTIPILIYVAWQAFCTLLAGNVSWHKAFSKQAAVLVFFLVAYGLKREEFKKIVVWYCVGAVMTAVWGILQWTPLFADDQRRAVGTRSHPLTYAESFIPAIFVLAGYLGHALLIQKEKLATYWKEITGLALILGGLIASESRGVWLGITAGLVPLLFSWPRKQAAYVAALLVLAASVVVISSPRLRHRAWTIVAPSIEGKAADEATSIRFELWKQSAHSIMQHPFTGVGIGGLKMVTLDSRTSREKTWGEAHNIYLQSAAEGGFIGLGLLLWVLLLGFKSVLAVRRDWKYVCLAIFTTFIIAGITESWTHDKEIAILFWGFMGFLKRE